MSKPVRIILGTHNSQPVGSFEYQLESAYQQAFKPYLSELYGFPDIPVVLHYTGNLLEWFEKQHPELVILMNEMINRKQIELLGGGYYNPIFPVIPVSDRIGQIEALTTFIRKHFGKRPRGSWITKGVWEPSLALTLRNSGIEYTFLDEFHFRRAGLSGEDLLRPVITEDQGKCVIVFPVSSFRNKMTEMDPEAFLEQLYLTASHIPDAVITLIRDGEHFGKNDDSYEYFYTKKWFERFFTRISEQPERFQIIHPGRYLRRHYPAKKCYFPCTSNEELMHWALDPPRKKEFLEVRREISNPEKAQAYITGGFFKQFITKYPDSNFLYSKMVYTNILVNQIRGDKSRKKSAREELWKGQAHNAYWHGKQGGIYHNRLRKETYRALIESEKITREKGIFIPSVITTDFDLDGIKEFLYQGHEINAYIHLRGGMLFELDYLPVSWNYLDSLTRREENYHDGVARREGYDDYPRKSFIDHFLKEPVDSDALQKAQLHEIVPAAESLYEIENFKREHKEINLKYELNESVGNETSVHLTLYKTYIFNRSSVHVYYRLTNEGAEHGHIVFAPEINLSAASAAPESHRIFEMVDRKKRELGNDTFEKDGISEFSLHDFTNDVIISVHSSKEFLLTGAPIFSVSRSMDELERIYQATSFLLQFPLEIEAGDSWETRISIRLDG